MNERLIDLLAKGHFFSGHSTWERKVEIFPMGKFRFFLTNCFGIKRDNDEDYFGGTLCGFLLTYLETWADLVKDDPKRPFDWKKYSSLLVRFFSFIENEKRNIFHKIAGGEKSAKIPIPPNDSQLIIHRAGDLLLFNISHITSETKEHRSGIRAVESLCRENLDNNLGVYELTQQLQVSFFLPKKRTENDGNEKKVDFEELVCMLQEALPYVSWDFSIADLISSYLKIEKGPIVGKYFNLNIRARLFHQFGEDDPKQIFSESHPLKEASRVWRQGNVQKESSSTYTFKMANDLKIALSIESSLPEDFFFDNFVKTDFKACREQFILATAASIFCSGLCSMISNAEQEASINLGN